MAGVVPVFQYEARFQFNFIRISVLSFHTCVIYKIEEEQKKETRNQTSSIMSTSFSSQPTFLSTLHGSSTQSTCPTTTYRFSLDQCIQRSETEHIYRIPSFDATHRWTHYKVTLHGQNGHLQRIPSVLFSSNDPAHHYCHDAPSAEWHVLPVKLSAYHTIRIPIPSTVYSDACYATILLRGYTADIV